MRKTFTRYTTAALFAVPFSSFRARPCPAGTKTGSTLTF